MTRQPGSDRTGVELGETPGPARARGLGCTYAWVGTEADNDPARGLYERAGGAGRPSRSCSTAGISPRPETRRPAETRSAPARTFS